MGSDVTILPILEVDYAGLDPSLPQILGYESKWEPDSPYWNDIKCKRAVFNPAAKRLLIGSPLLLLRAPRCRDYTLDFRTDTKGVIKLLEANPNPGWCWDGKMNLPWRLAGYTCRRAVCMIVEAAQLRYGAAPALEHARPPVNLVPYSQAPPE